MFKIVFLNTVKVPGRIWWVAVLLFVTGCLGRGVAREGGIFSNFMLPSVREEQRLGDMFRRELERRVYFIEDPFIREYINEVGELVSRNARSHPFEYHFYVFYDPRINAFAAPAGQVFVTTGLLMEAEDESELAGVLCHEIAHVSHRHVARMIQQQQGIALPTIVGIMAGMLVRDPEVGQAIIAGTLAGQMSLSLSYTRSDEEEADQYGLVYLQRAGYDPRGIIRFLGRLIKEYGVESGVFAPYLLTHPPLIRRVSYLETLVPPGYDQPVAPPDHGLGRVQVTVIGQNREVSEAREYFQRILEEDPEDPHAHFGMGLIHRRAKEWEKALEEFEWVRRRDDRDVQVLWEIGMTYLDSGQYESAIRIFREEAAVEKDNKYFHYELGRALHKAGQYEEAVKAYLKAVTLDPDMPAANYQLGMIHGEHEQFGRAHRYLGRYFQLCGEWEKARFHFQKALSYYDQDSPEVKEIKADMERKK